MESGDISDAQISASWSLGVIHSLLKDVCNKNCGKFADRRWANEDAMKRVSLRFDVNCICGDLQNATGL